MYYVSFNEFALKQLNKYVDVLDEEESGLGFDFLVEIQNQVDFLSENPKAHPKIHHEVRRTYLGGGHHFRIYYRVFDRRVDILAIYPRRGTRN